MIRTLLICAAALGLGFTAAVHAQQGLLPKDLITTQTSNGKLSVVADLSNLEEHLSDTLARTYANQNCGDVVSANNVDLVGTGSGAALTANVTMTRWQCTSIVKPVCKGFVCRKETQEYRNKVYQTSFPLALDIKADTTKQGTLQFVVSPRRTSGLKKAFLGQEELFENATVAFQRAATTSLNQLSGDLANSLTNPRAFDGFDPGTTRFGTAPNGSLMLNLQLPSR